MAKLFKSNTYKETFYYENGLRVCKLFVNLHIEVLRKYNGIIKCLTWTTVENNDALRYLKY